MVFLCLYLLVKVKSHFKGYCSSVLSCQCSQYHKLRDIRSPLDQFLQRIIKKMNNFLKIGSYNQVYSVYSDYGEICRGGSMTTATPKMEHFVLHLKCCGSPRSASDLNHTFFIN